MLLVLLVVVLPLALALLKFLTVTVFPAPDDVKVEPDLAVGTGGQVVQVFAQNNFLLKSFKH